MRPVANAQSQPQGIDAGLLKYASIIITNEVNNEFKSLGRTDDISRVSCSSNLSPEFGDAESLAFDADSEDGSPRIISDHAAIEKFVEVENQTDIAALLKQSTITPDELAAIEALDILGQAARDYSRQINVPVTKVHKLHLSGLKKLKSARVGEVHANRILHEVCERYGCTEDQVLGDDRFGDPVKARNELFGSLSRDGMSEDDMAFHFDYPREKIAAAVSRDARARQ
jgi:DNA-directed RNA polymerase specialized sigma24 family protein